MVKACKLFHLTEDFSVDTASTDNASVAVMCVAHWKKKIPRAVLLRPNDILLERGAAHEKKIYLLLKWWCCVTSF